jgi:hypothetical protein
MRIIGSIYNGPLTAKLKHATDIRLTVNMKESILTENPHLPENSMRRDKPRDIKFSVR